MVENTYISSLPAALIAASAWTAVLAASATPLQNKKSAYLNGLLAAAIAYVVAVGLIAFASILLPQTPGSTVVVILAPVVEESIRLVAALEVARRTESRFGLAFGVGYGLLEAGLKLGDQLVLIARTGSTDAADWLTATIFVVPFLLHLFLSVLVFTLLRRGVAPLVVLVIAMACHAFHNWTVLAILPSDVPGLLLSVAIRTPVLLGLTVLAARFAPVR